MRSKIYWLAIIALTVSSCEDVISVELDDTRGLLVVDAWLDDLPDTEPQIQLSLAVAYFDSLSNSAITDATVTVSSSGGNTYTFDNLSPDGIYTLNDASGWDAEAIGNSFDLRIEIGDRVISATSEKFRAPEIDSITQELREDEVFSEDGIYCNFFATDLEGLGDTYWIKSYKNGIYLNLPGEINLAYDAAFSAGAEVDNLVFIQPIQELVNPIDENFAPLPYVAGDSLRVEIHAISNEAYYYMELLRDQLLNSSNGIFAEPQANTSGNLSSSDGETVLGFFSVASTSFLSRVID